MLAGNLSLEEPNDKVLTFPKPKEPPFFQKNGSFFASK